MPDHVSIVKASDSNGEQRPLRSSPAIKDNIANYPVYFVQSVPVQTTELHPRVVLVVWGLSGFVSGSCWSGGRSCVVVMVDTGVAGSSGNIPGAPCSQVVAVLLASPGYL